MRLYAMYVARISAKIIYEYCCTRTTINEKSIMLSSQSEICFAMVKKMTGIQVHYFWIMIKFSLYTCMPMHELYTQDGWSVGVL